MRIYDLPASVSLESRRIALIGSCRLHLPFNRLEARREARRRWMDHAVTHTTAESAQNIDIVEGIHPPRILLPYILQPAELPAPGAKEILQTVDTFLVEISDNRIIKAGDWILQANYLTRHLIQKHAAALFGWWKEICSKGAAEPETIDAAVSKLRAAEVEDLDQLGDVLRFARMTRQTPDEIASGVVNLTKRLPGRWIFVSHFAVPDSGTLMEDRRSLIRAVSDGAAAAGAEFFDPSVLIERHGRATALAGDGADIYEYADPFNEVVASEYIDIIAGGAGASGDGSAANRPNAVKRKPVDIASVVDKVGRDLVSIHSKRLSEKGRDASGLFEHYETLVKNGEIIPRSEANRLLHILEFMPPFDRYVVYRAGLGELGFALAMAGRDVTVWEPNPARHEAIKEAAAILSKKYPAIRRHFHLAEEPLAEIEINPAESTLGIALGLLILKEGQDEAELVPLVARTTSLLYSARHFLRSRNATNADDEARNLLERVGYSHFEKLPIPETTIASR